MTLLTAAAKNFGGLFALRWFVGVGESAFFPLVIYYQVIYLFEFNTATSNHPLDYILSTW